MFKVKCINNAGYYPGLKMGKVYLAENVNGYYRIYDLNTKKFLYYNLKHRFITEKEAHNLDFNNILDKEIM